jgi:hypothetical protein
MSRWQKASRVAYVTSVLLLLPFLDLFMRGRLGNSFSPFISDIENLLGVMRGACGGHATTSSARDDFFFTLGHSPVVVRLVGCLSYGLTLSVTRQDNGGCSVRAVGGLARRHLAHH